MTPLEERYRKLLRLLPGDYRDRWGDDMVETFLAGISLLAWTRAAEDKTTAGA